MKLPFSISFDLIAAEAQAVIDCGIEWDKGTPTLRVDDVLDSTGKVSLFHVWKDMACTIADFAESDERLLARAVERDVLEREAA
jgi:hypothetical protein